MTSAQCRIGELSKAANGIVTLAVTCLDREISKSQMMEAVAAIDLVAGGPSPLFVDASRPHSVSFDALVEMSKASNVLAVAIYAPSVTSRGAAEFIMNFQQMVAEPPYPFSMFSDLAAAEEWLKTFT